MGVAGDSNSERFAHFAGLIAYEPQVLRLKETNVYHAIIKRVTHRFIQQVNDKDYAAVLKGCSPNIHHRFGGQHALGGERHDREALGR